MRFSGRLLRHRASRHVFLNPERLEDRRLLSVSSDRTILSSPLDTNDPPYGGWSVPANQALIDPAQVFNLQSKPGSNFTIYLDFNGHITTGTSWNSNYGVDPIISPAFDLDGDRTSFSQLELQGILTSWQRTAEDYAPFDINVTTRDPGIDALTNSGGGDTTWGARAVVSVDNFANCGCGGFAFLGSFTDSIDTPTFIFNVGEGSLGETFSHEVGHMLTLNHDGTSAGGLEYYRGHGGLGTTGWGAIMGAPFTQNVTQWDRGQYFDANNAGDDLLDITTQNGFGYRVDDAGNTRATAKLLEVDNQTTARAFGFIERTSDIDYYQFETGAGNISLDVRTLATRPNLDVWAGLYNAAGTLIAQGNPQNSLSASITNLAVAAGTYYLRVEGIGSHDTYNPGTDTLVPPAAPVPWSVSPANGYSDYGSLGQYAIQATIVAPSANTIQIVATDASKLEGASGQQPFTFTVSRSGDTSGAATVSYNLGTPLPLAVGDNYPSIATANDFAAGTSFSGSVLFDPNEVSKTLTFQVLGDGLTEQDEYFDIVLSSPTAGWKLGDSKATGAILSDEVTVGIPALGANLSVNEGPFDGALVRWRQIGPGNGAADEWGLDNITLANSSLSDDFDPGIDSANWLEISNGTVNSNFTGSDGNALFMSGGNDRRVVTRLLHANPGDLLTFDIIFGDSTNGGENADPGEDVVLEFSLNNGSNWTEFAIFDTEDYTTWTTVQATLPSGIDTNPPATLAFTVAREGGVNLPVTVDWTVELPGLPNDANAADFSGGQLPSGQIQFDVGESSATIVIPIQGDTVAESDEGFRVRILSATGPGAISLDPALLTALGTIRNDDASYLLNPGSLFRLRQKAFNGGAFDNWGIDNVSLSQSSFGDDFDPTIDLAQWSSVQSGVVNTNFGGSGNSLYFTGTGTSRSITTVPLQARLGDSLAFDLIYGSDTNGGENPETGEEVVLEYSVDRGTTWTLVRTYPLPNITWSRKTETIPAGAALPPSTLAEGNAGATNFSFVIERVGASTGTSSVSWSVVGSGLHPANSSDFVGGTLPSGNVTFASGEVRKTVTIQVAGDTGFEANETFDFVVGSGAGQLATTATITNDDAPPPGDFNQDGAYNCLDINLLVAAVASGSGGPSFDLTGDGLVNPADVTRWLAVAGSVNLASGNPYLPGDANLDGTVDGPDFNIWNANKFTTGSGWCGGDFSADGVTDGSDFNIWNANKFTSALFRGGNLLPADAVSGARQLTYICQSKPMSDDAKLVATTAARVSHAIPRRVEFADISQRPRRTGFRTVDQAFAELSVDFTFDPSAGTH